MTRGKEYFLWILVALVFVTASMDIFLVMNVAGFNVRLALLVMMVLEAFWMVSLVRSRRLFLISGMGWLVLLALLNTVFALNSSLPLRSFGYALWLWVFVVWVFVMVQVSAGTVFFQEEKKTLFSRLFVVYMLSFLPALLVGWLQWIVPSLAWIREGLWRTQWTLPLFGEYSLYRVNGWNYEPSYYATYLVVLPPLLWVWFRQSKGHEKFFVFLYLILTVLMIGLSTSRMGWIALGIEGMVILLIEVGLWFRKRWGARAFRGLLLFGIGWVMVSGVGFLLFFPWEKVAARILAHSYFDRMGGIQNTLEVFFRHPFASVSLGGVAPDIALFRGNIVPQGNSDVKPFEGAGVPLELLAGLGVLGAFVVAGLLASLFFFSFFSWRRFSSQEKAWFLALAGGLVMQGFLLLFNQNILRVYVWNHVAMFIGFLAWKEGKGLAPSLTLPSGALKVGTSMFTGILAMTVAGIVFVFQPLVVEVEGAKLHGEWLIKSSYGRVYYNTGRGIYGYESVSLLIDDKRASLSFISNRTLSRRYFESEEAFYLWKTLNSIMAKTNSPDYIYIPTTNLYFELVSRNNLFVKNPQKFLEGLNFLLEDETFWEKKEKSIRFSPLTMSYGKKKGAKDFDPIRYHRLLLEDWLVWIPRNPEGHNPGLWLFEFSYPISYLEKPVNEMLKVESIELQTSWGRVELPWKPDFWVEENKEEKQMKVRSWFSWSGNRWFVQAQFLRFWWTVVTVVMGFVVGAMTWYGIEKKKK
ncbi:MAG: O-antigen ligase family protein [Brevinematales bacterium]|nr:O-antigen ligase family protein [Brevinematales bacterium]